MFFLRVLDLVVADAVEALDEHHNGGDGEAGDFGGVVEGAGGEAMRDGAGLGDGFVAEGDEIGVEEDRFDHRGHQLAGCQLYVRGKGLQQLDRLKRSSSETVPRRFVLAASLELIIERSRRRGTRSTRLFYPQACRRR